MSGETLRTKLSKNSRIIASKLSRLKSEMKRPTAHLFRNATSKEKKWSK